MLLIDIVVVTCLSASYKKNNRPDGHQNCGKIRPDWGEAFLFCDPLLSETRWNNPYNSFSFILLPIVVIQ